MVHLSSIALHSVLTGLCLWQIIKNSIDYYNTRTTIVTTTGLADVDQVSLDVSALPPRTGLQFPVMFRLVVDPGFRQEELWRCGYASYYEYELGRSR